MGYDVTKIFQRAPMVKLGELLEVADEYNSNGLKLQFFGVNKDKQFMPTIANTEGLNPTKYKIIRKNIFVFSGMQTGRDMCIRFALYTDDNPVLLSPAYTLLRVKDESIIIPEYLFIYFLSSERDRLGAFYSDASVRANLELYRFFQMEIPLPAIEVQREYVAAYRSLQQLAEQNEALAAPLQEACNAFLAKISAQYDSALLGDLITEYSEKNTNNKIKIVKSVSVTKEFNDTNAKVNKNELSGYKIVLPLYISYVQTTKNEKCLASAINKYGYPIVVTSVNRVITSTNLEILDNEYLAMWLRTPEFSRWAIYNSWGSAREVFDFSDLCLSKIPLPPIEVQRSIVALYNCAEEARAIAKEAREQLKILAPAMVQRAANTPVEV